jgi:hypothetical protein
MLHSVSINIASGMEYKNTKTASTCFGVTVTPSSQSALICGY